MKRVGGISNSVLSESIHKLSDAPNNKPRYATLTVFYTISKQPTESHTAGEVLRTEDQEGKIVDSLPTEQQQDLMVVVCRRGVGGVDYGKIYSCGGAIDRRETAEEAACREAWEESGIRIHPNQLQRFSPSTPNPKMAHFYVILENRPEIHGATDRHAWEVLYERSILNYPTTKCWAAIPVNELADHFIRDKSSTSAFSRLFLDMYENIFNQSCSRKEKCS